MAAMGRGARLAAAFFFTKERLARGAAFWTRFAFRVVFLATVLAFRFRTGIVFFDLLAMGILPLGLTP